MTRRGRLWLRRRSPISSTPTINPLLQGPSQAPSPDVPSDTGPAGSVSQKWLAWMRRAFIRSNKNHPRPVTTDAVGTSASDGAQEQRDQLQAIPTLSDQRTTGGEAMPPVKVLEDAGPSLRTCEGPVGPLGGASAACGTTLASLGSVIDATQQSLDRMKPIPWIGQPAIHGVAQADAVVTNIQNISNTYLQPLKLFNSIVSNIAKVHPYAQIALGVLTAASQALLNQANLDNEVSSLLDMVGGVYEFLTEEDTIQNIDNMAETLGKIAGVISDAVQFVKDYSEVKSFWVRLGKNTVSERQTIIDSYTKALDALMQQYRDRAVRDIQINTRFVLQDLSLDGMAYAGGAGLNTTKKCLDGTRTEILAEIVSWIQDVDERAPRILWLHGQAGRGKSAIAHTIALGLKRAGSLGSCFCFARNRQAEHREEKIFTTIARDLADRDPAFRRVLADVLAKEHSLKTTSDVTQQWEKLILEPLSKVSRTMIGNVVVVVDALDESGPEGSRRDILSVLASQARDLPCNLRIFVTSRPLPDIEHVLSAAPHVKATSLDDISRESAEHDIRLYVSKQLDCLAGFGDTEIQRITWKADCLFEWARLACDYIKPNRLGTTVKERYDDVVGLQSEGGRTLLDTTYSVILESIVPKSGKALERYHSVMRQVVMTLEPLPMTALDHMRKHFPNEQDHQYDVSVILEFMSPLLGGILDHASPVRPLHASFYDFLTDQSRSGAYFIDTSCPYDLAIATLQTLHHEVQFNICGLESSYLSNVEVADLPERISKNILPHLSYSCRFWSHHLEKTTFDRVVAELVKTLVGSEKILFWLEVMSLLDEVGNASAALMSTAAWLLDQDGFKDTLTLIEDGIKFIHSFSGAISHSAPHLYISALAFIPVKTMLSMMLMPKFSSLPGLKGGLEHWPSILLALEGHTDQVDSVAFSPSGKRIVSGSKDKTIRVWDAERGVQIGSYLEGHTAGVSSVAFSPDGKRIVSGSWDNTIRVWDAERGTQIGSCLEGHVAGVASVAFSPDGKRIVSGSGDKTVRVWDAERGVQMGNDLEGHIAGVSSVVFSPDGKRIASGSEDKTVRVWDAERGVQIGSHLEWHIAPVCSVAFSSDGKQIVSGSWDNTLGIWDVESGVHIGSDLEGHTAPVTSVAFSPDCKRVVSGSLDNTVRVWDAERRVQISSHLEGNTAGIYSVAFSPDGKRIVSGLEDNTVRVWDAEQGLQIVSHLERVTAPVSSVAFSPDGKRIVSGSWDSTVWVWDAENGVQIGSDLEGHAAPVSSFAFSPDGKRIVSGSWDNTVKVWDAESGVQMGSDFEGHIAGVSSVAFSPDSKRIVSGSEDNTIRVWDAERGVQVGSHLEGHTAGVSSVAFSPDGKRIVSGSEDNTVRVWNAESGVQVGNHFEGHTAGVCSVAFSPDGWRIVSGSWDNTVKVWDVEKGVQFGNDLEGHMAGVCSVAFSPDSRRIVSGSLDNTVMVWDVERGIQVGSDLEGHTAGVCSVAFSPDGEMIVSGSGDKTVRVWDANGHGHITNTHENLSDKHVLCHGINPYHICFSSISSHALCDSEQLLGGLLPGDRKPWAQLVKLHHDGWIRGPNGTLLLWIPVTFREPFYSMWTTRIIPKDCCIELDLSQMAHGQKWHKCYRSTC